MKLLSKIALTNEIKYDDNLKEIVEKVIHYIKKVDTFAKFIKVNNEKNFDIKISISNEYNEYDQYKDYFIWLIDNKKINEWKFNLHEKNFKIIERFRDNIDEAIYSVLIVYIHQITLINLMYKLLIRENNFDNNFNPDYNFVMQMGSHKKKDDDIGCLFDFSFRKTNLKLKIDLCHICDKCKIKILKNSKITNFDLENFERQLKYFVRKKVSNKEKFEIIRDKYWWLLLPINILIVLISLILSIIPLCN